MTGKAAQADTIAYRLKVIEAEVESVKLNRGRFLVCVRNKQFTDHVKRSLDNWYRKQARRVFAERLAAFYPKVKRFGIPYPELLIRSMEKRWGSCTAEGRPLLNLKLIQVPKPYIDYVILHELCHLKEHHHGPASYAFMDRLLPDWREKRKALHQVELT